MIWELIDELLPGDDGSRGPAATPPSFLTPQWRDRLLKQLHPEGQAVITADGKEYTGRTLGESGLPQQGILYLREVCRTIPPWGEAHWDKLHKNKKKKGTE